MWMPLRIDHHGWQLAMLGLLLVGLTDKSRARGGAIAGGAAALSLSIGLEMLIYLAAAGAEIALMGIRDGGQTRRLAAYGARLAGGTAHREDARRVGNVGVSMWRVRGWLRT